MPYTLIKFLLWFVLAAVIGFAIGWSLRSLDRRAARQARKAETGVDDGTERDARHAEELRVVTAERDRLRILVAELRATDSPGIVGADRRDRRSTDAVTDSARPIATAGDDPVADTTQDGDARPPGLRDTDTDTEFDTESGDETGVDGVAAGTDSDVAVDAEFGTEDPADAAVATGLDTDTGPDERADTGDRDDGFDEAAGDDATVAVAADPGEPVDGTSEDDGPEDDGPEDGRPAPEGSVPAAGEPAGDPLAEMMTPDVVEGAQILGRRVTLDDLALVEGIGPKISEICRGAGISTWRDLANAEVDDLRRMLDAAGPRYGVHRPDTWPRQAAMLADGRWTEFRQFLDEH